MRHVCPFPCRQPKLFRRPQMTRFFISIYIKSSFPVHLWYKTAAINGDLQYCMHFLLLNLIILGMIKKFYVWKR